VLGGLENEVEVAGWHVLDAWLRVFEVLPAVVLSFRGRWALLAFRALRLMFSDTF